MYTDYYQLTADPFQLTPDVRYVFEYPYLQRVREKMLAAVDRGERVLLLSGRSGTGKTTLAASVTQRLQARGDFVAQIAGASTGDSDILQMVAYALGIRASEQERFTVLQTIELKLKQQRHTLLIIDEAQHLSAAALKPLWLLMEPRGKQRPALQLLLLGPQTLVEHLHEQALAQFEPSLVALHKLEPLNLTDAVGLVRHRLQCANWQGQPAFEHSLFILLHRASQGLPRHLCKQCSRLLQHGASQALAKVGFDDTLQVILSMQDEQLLPSVDVVDRTAAPLPALDALIKQPGRDLDQRLALTEEEKAFIEGGWAQWGETLDQAVPLVQANTQAQPDRPVEPVIGISANKFTDENGDVLISVELGKPDDQRTPAANISTGEGRIRKRHWLWFVILAVLVVLSVRHKVEPIIADYLSYGMSDSVNSDQVATVVVHPDTLTTENATAGSEVSFSSDHTLADEQVTTPAVVQPEPVQTEPAQSRRDESVESVSVELPESTGVAERDITWQQMHEAQPESVAFEPESAQSGSELRQLPTMTETEDAGFGHREPASDHEALLAEVRVISKDMALSTWLRWGADALAAFRLTTPRQNNAWYFYHKVLALDADNTEAKQGLEQIPVRYAILAQSALSRSDLRRARRYIERGLKLQPGNRTLLNLQLELAQRETALEQAEKNDMEPDAVQENTNAASDISAEDTSDSGFFKGLRRMFSDE
ncbi:MAG: ExeA family protein [Parahaliea sp.]